MRGSLRRMGRPPVYSDCTLVQQGVTLRPTQRERLQAYAAARGTNLSAVLREIVSGWEREQGWEEPAAS